MRIHIRASANYYHPVLYVLKIMEKNQGVTFDFVDTAEGADLVWDHLNEYSQPVSLQFYDVALKDMSLLSHSKIFEKAAEIYTDRGQKDIVATIFYMINCLQEFPCDETMTDRFGRFRYEASYQHRFGQIEENLVQQEIDSFFNLHRIQGSPRKSAFFISHDIDTIYGSLLQDGFWAAKKLKIGVILSLLANELMRRPHWKNIDQMLRINSEYDVRSTFFWLVNRGKGTRDIQNADYDINREQKLVELVERSGFTNGLHKSCSDMTIDGELKKGRLEEYPYNRYHFLNFSVKADWPEISESRLEFDSSLGFAERYGFRNSYGRAFQPFDLENKRPYNFVEAPLHFMDGTFHKYMQIQADQIGSIVIDFFEKNPYNCDFSLLWHNTYFTDYKYNSFLNEYKKILAYIYENKISSLTPQQIIQQNTLTWSITD